MGEVIEVLAVDEYERAHKNTRPGTMAEATDRRAGKK